MLLRITGDHEMAARREVEDFLRMLAEYGLRLEDLVKNNPRSWQDRERAKRVAYTLANNQQSMAYIKEHRCPPPAAMEIAGSDEEKLLERNFPYITGLALILSGRFPTIGGILSTWTGGDR